MKDKIFYLIFFVLVLAFSRIIPHPQNFTPILASSIMAPLLIKDRSFGIAIPVIAMFISDIFIGFHPYQFAIYLTLISIGILSPMKNNSIHLGVMAIGGSVLFYITTNFAVWIIWDFYPKTIEGLISCYTLALPFFKNTLISTLIFTGLLALLAKYIELLRYKCILVYNRYA